MGKNFYIDEVVKQSLERYRTDIYVLSATWGIDLVTGIFTVRSLLEKNEAYKLGGGLVLLLSLWAISQHQSLKNSEIEFFRNVNEKRIHLAKESSLFLLLGERLAANTKLREYFTQARENQ